MTLHPVWNFGTRMTAEAYDDAVALRAYVLQHFPHLMTPLERRTTEYSAPIVSHSEDRKVRKIHQFLEKRDGHVEDADVITAMETPYEDRVAAAVDRILRTQRGDLFENRCAACKRLVRTPIAKQCLWCGYDWH